MVIHPLPACTIIVNVIVAATALELLKVPLMLPLPPNPIEELIPDGLSLDQPVIVPAGKPVMPIEVIEVPLQISWLCGETVTCGFTVIVNVAWVPVHVLPPLV